MCYLCFKDDPFKTSRVSDANSKRKRMLEIKQLLKEIEEYPMCDIGDATVERLRNEQFKLSREM